MKSSLSNIVHAQTKAPIKVGFPTPLTGPFGTEAQDQVRCAEIAIKEFNESGGLNGRMAELLVRILHRVRVVRADPTRLIEGARRIDHEVRRFADHRRTAYVTVLLSQCAARVVGWLNLYAITLLLGLASPFGRVALLYAALHVSEMLIVVLPARLGVSEGAAYFIFQLFHLPPEMGIIVTLVGRLKALATNGLAAPFALHGGGRPAPATG